MVNLSHIAFQHRHRNGKRPRKQPACCKKWLPEREELLSKRPVLDAVTNMQDESTGLVTGMWSFGNMKLDDINHNGKLGITADTLVPKGSTLSPESPAADTDNTKSIGKLLWLVTLGLQASMAKLNQL